ncbi:MAG: hypothetical protein HW400_39 [Candidatus Levybacteria bacterium]|nr:hypothetical protein [Candidatus Levybacteria bacterium]
MARKESGEGRGAEFTTLVSVMDRLKATEDLWYAERPIISKTTYSIFPSEKAEIFVAPITPLFEVRDLSRLTRNLGKRLNAFEIIPPHNYARGKGMVLGSLGFLERIATVKEVIRDVFTAINPEAVKRLEIPEKREGKTKRDLMNQIVVRIFPDTLSAKVMSAAGLSYTNAQGYNLEPENELKDLILTTEQINFLKKNQNIDLDRATRAMEVFAQNEDVKG